MRTKKDAISKMLHTGSKPPGKEEPKSENLESNNAAPPQLQRRLKSRHLQMIAIGGTIGTGLVRHT